ncbi:hypothetical protein GCM10009641_14510 [Mycobacterium cookii]|uniref:Alanine and proline rich membrane protein n=1 Tax=Mycobacterium cookii TaxID=1775 RepID=A0A7I7L120_9MYCO|nr:hypothetical protein [Mycobacterium cookii]MCV7330557.1 hypothetical protein [Mycobacterium cookii]BBX47252.1 hypothetical protein MCOO_32670 [Mycobacterium cookii]
MTDLSPAEDYAADAGPQATSHRRARIPDAKPNGWTAAALTLAVLATALAIAAWFNPLHRPPHFSGQQTADAKSAVCQAYTVVCQSVITNTHLGNPAPNDPVGELAIAVNARLALLGGGAFLTNRLAAQPATPADLSTAITAMISTLEELGNGYLAGTGSTLDPLRHTLDDQMTELNRLCS